MTVNMAAAFQNGRHENIKQCVHVYISYFRGILCAIHALIVFQGQRIHDTCKLKIMRHFQNYGKIQINVDRWCYMYDNF